MTLEEFLEIAARREPLNAPDVCAFMDKSSDEARRITFELNGSYHTPEEVRALLSRLFGADVDPTLRVFPPFYTDFGKNIHIGKNVFINACCQFQNHGGITDRRRLPDWAQCGVCDAEPRSCARRPQDDLSRADCARQKRLGWVEQHDTSRRVDWRQRGRCGGCGGGQRRSRRHGCCGRSRQGCEENTRRIVGIADCQFVAKKDRK